MKADQEPGDGSDPADDSPKETPTTYPGLPPWTDR